MAFNILSVDSLRRTVEQATDGANTVLYDAKGNPSFMAVIPRMTVGDVFTGITGSYGSGVLSTISSDVHPAFTIYEGDYEDEPHTASEIFISLYNNTLNSDIPCSIPGQPPALVHFESTDNDLRTRIDQKGTGWHMMNVWEYSLLQMWSASRGYVIEGDDGKKTSEVISGDPPYFGIPVTGEQSQTGKYYIGKFAADITGIFLDGEEILVFATDPRIDPDNALYVGRGFLEYAKFWYFSETVPNYVLMLIDEPYGDFEYGYYIMGSKSKAIFTIDDIFNVPLEGTGTNNWRHNHAFSGVYGLNNQLQLIDGFELRNNLTTKEKSIYFTPGNYLNWDADLLMTSGASMYGYGEDYDPEIFIGEPGLDSEYGIFTFPGADGLGQNVEGTPLTKDSDFDSNVSLADRQLLALLGFPPYNIAALSGMDDITDANRVKIFCGDDDNYETFFLAKNFRRPLPTSVPVNTHWSCYVVRNMWNNNFFTTSPSGSVRVQTFRTCYVY